MIDLHCHILPGIDDGAVDLADSVAMARQGAADGIETICATPHIRHDHDVRVHEVAGRVSDLNAELARRGVAVKVIASGEVAESAVDRLTDEELRTLALGGRWVLLEPAPGPLGESLAGAAERLRRRGYRSLIAHPERHPAPDMGDRLRDRPGGLPGAGDGRSAGRGRRLGADARSGATRSRARARQRLPLGPPRSTGPDLGRLARLREAAEMRPHLEWIANQAPAAIVSGQDLEPPFAAV